jgi:hypothetical protein
LVKLYSFDGVERDEFDENILIPNIDVEKELIIGLEKFSNRRSK